ncbi:MAG: hypothetical protein GF308_00430 [Candidatus Heimdallarchaeota archaeon]|nr:hypothetical protein [Candidatus Heimdallarchaeota archaeon]
MDFEEEKNSKITFSDRSPSELLSRGFQREINLVKIGSGILILSFLFFLIYTTISTIITITDVYGKITSIFIVISQNFYSILLVVGIICLSIALHRLTNYFPNRYKITFIISYLLLDLIIIFRIVLAIISHSIVIFQRNILVIALTHIFDIVLVSVCISISLILLGFILNQLKSIDGMNVWLLIMPFISVIVPIFILGSGVPYMLGNTRVFEILFIVSLFLYSFIEIGVFLELLLAFNRIEPKKIFDYIYQ